ncbi:hypothetical protein CIK77_10265 [Microbacterium sp. JB110]|nr:hypothetical protein CIK77_10265 [Microbacterium sp. JB110]SJM49241.1 hypothetical protein CZ774_04110 [Frigoribacterium sp. JB110]
MPPMIRRMVKTGKLGYLWVTRILLAPNRFRVPLLTRLRLAVFGGFIGDQHVLYDLKNRSKREYLSEFDWYRSRWINEPFDAMLNNKIICNEVLQPHINVSPILFVKNKRRLVRHGAGRTRVSTADVVQGIRDHGSFFMKPLTAGKGKGVHRLDAVDGRLFVDEAEMTEAELVAFLDGQSDWFLTETVAQHPDLAAIFPRTSNTIRLITMRTGDGGAQPFFAVLRIGTADTVPVDNGSRGGLVAKIDIDSGVLSEARTLWSQGVHRVHPNSGAPIEGTVVPRWQEVVDSALRVADEFPFLQFVAWDFLVGEDDIWVIEANTSSGVNIVQLWGGQRYGQLGDFYRAHEVIK